MAATERVNRLGRETSPYLLQHARNPVDWYPWGREAIDRARTEAKPIFLSIGYSACHWCHVMERESFENPDIAAVMNQHFVNVKVDREERPDIDEIYMQFVQQTTGSGGWPMSVFLTPELHPFFGGTYFPPVSSHGRPGFSQVLKSIAEQWEKNRERIEEHGQKFAESLARDAAASTEAAVHPEVLDESLSQLMAAHDPLWGGFGSAPKFPHALDLRLLLRHWKRSGNGEARRAVVTTLDRMREGGIYDHLGGGFARYSTDEKWLIPHFEKMLYDTALLVPAYLEACLVAGTADYAVVARECCDWVLREMVTPEGGFASSIDADSEGREGEFYVWTAGEIRDVLGPREGAWAAAWFGVGEPGNFERDANALWCHESRETVAGKLGVPLAELVPAMKRARAKLFAARERRVHPGKDDKVLASWNGLMIAALAQAYQVLGDERYLEAARTAACWILKHMRQSDGRLFATSRGGEAHLNACLDDYAFLIQGLIDLYESDFDPHWLSEALALDGVLRKHFEDERSGGYFTTGDNHEKLLVRLRSVHDGALPAGSGVQALNLLRLAQLSGRTEFARRAERVILSLGAMVNRYPAGFSQLLIAADYLAARPREIVVAGELTSRAVREMLVQLRGTFLPQRVVALADGRADTSLIPLLEGKSAPSGGARAYVCRNYACRRPVETAADLLAELKDP